jgi:succinate-acetate transporter protein
MLTKWLGVIEAAVVFGGLAGLVTGMYWLATNPLFGVVAMLVSMALLLSLVGKLSEAQEVQHQSGARGGRFSRSRAGSSGN